MVRFIHPVIAILLTFGLVCIGEADEVSALRLVPFPKQVELQTGTFSLQDKLVLEAPSETAELLAGLISAELRHAGLPAVAVRGITDKTGALRLSARPGRGTPSFTFAADAVAEGYALEVHPQEIVCGGTDAAGLFYGVQTLCQLIRANRTDNVLPCLKIRDWPSLRWRCFQDDLTRGPSSTPRTLQQHVDLGSTLKMNLFTYYMEYQFAFKKHPMIGPENGSLTPECLAALVEYAKPQHVDILGNQQSFGHLTHILKHEQYSSLRENDYIITPVKEETYQLLDDLYSEVCPLLPFAMFNVCCDETFGLGKGPSKELAQEIGVGGVYVRHIRRVHDLLKDRYGKRMMMWGDIILQHPDKLDQIPKDTVMLTWGYSAAANFEQQIIPFAESGYEFLVCPGISNWSRILPDFGVASTNIQNFVRDGAKHGTLGMLNTAWEDDGEALQGYKWHGYAWGAECAWNASTTTLDDFHRRIGAVLFGENGDHFGQAIELLSQAHRLPGMKGMMNSRFWANDFHLSQSVKTTRATADRLLKVVQPAITHIQACQRDATVNAELLDALLLGAQRMERIGLRMLDGLRAAEAYTRAFETSDRQKCLALLIEIEQIVSDNRRAHAELGREFARIWLSESKPFALDLTLARYEKLDKTYADLAARLANARKQVETDGSLPAPAEMGLELPTAFSRLTRPAKRLTDPLKPDAPWAETTATHRLGVSIDAGSVDRYQLPIEIDVKISNDLASKPVRAFCSLDNQDAQEVPVQLTVQLAAQLAVQADAARLTLVLPGPITKQTTATVQVYLGLPKRPKRLNESVITASADGGMVSIENDKVRLLLGPEGAHIYRWEVKATEDRDMTLPGMSDFSGFSDVGAGRRNMPHELLCTAQGPALVRYVCTDPLGSDKTISLFAGSSWVEVLLDDPVNYYWAFDNPENFAADGPTPGIYLFANGQTGPVGKQADGIPAQVKAGDVRWAIKFNDQKLALGMTTPELLTNFVVGPGAGAGGVGIEASRLASHFITFAGRLEQEPGETMNRLQQSLNFKNQPAVTLHALQEK